ncbi:MAG: VWA domain-containing protein [Acidimicrobiaceae bacterium]|nr:VWA domain-containing protein [Acidimicrobiaceae bacterium]
MPDPERIVAGFGRALRAAGLDVPTGSVVLFAQALGCVGLERRDLVYWAGRATLVRRPEDVPTYDRIFDAFWLDRPGQPAPSAVARSLTLAVDVDDDGADAPEGEPEPTPQDVLAVRYSAVETLRDRDFAALNEAEWAETQRLLSRLRLTGDPRRSRRRRPSRRRSGHPDLRRTVRRSLRHEGVPIHRAWKQAATRPRRVVLLVDVSGSMEPYARALLRFAHAVVSARGSGRVEAFTLGTRLTRLTRELGQRDPDAALSAAARRVEDWSGGTRLGEGLHEFNDRWGVRGMARGAVVVILSDGWDRGDPEALAEQMARLGRVAHRVVWVNPLKATPGYAPLARGMAAALPYVDEFVEGHSLDALERLAELVAVPGSRRENVT